MMGLRFFAAWVVWGLCFLGSVSGAWAQSGECNAGGCPRSSSQFPITTLSTTSASFVTVSNSIAGGSWARYNVTNGRTYEWSLCSADGGASTYNTLLTLRTDATPGIALCVSDDAPGCTTTAGAPGAAKITWTSNVTGTVIVQLNESLEGTCSTNARVSTLRWRCVDCNSTNFPPVVTSAVVQQRTDTLATIPDGGSIPSGVGVQWRVTGTDQDPGDTYRLEIELRALPATFNSVATHASPLVASGAPAITASATGLAPGNYGWRSRLIDSRGLATTWASALNPNFVVLGPTNPVIRVQPSALSLSCPSLLALDEPMDEPDHSPIVIEADEPELLGEALRAGDPGNAGHAEHAQAGLTSINLLEAMVLRGILGSPALRKEEHAVHARMIERLLEGDEDIIPVSQVCFAPGSDENLVGAFNAALNIASDERFNLQTRWGATALSPVGSNGDPITITYSFVPDGTFIPASSGDMAGTSNLFAFMNSIYGSPNVWRQIFADVFARWSALSGIDFVYQPTDDGAAFITSPGLSGVRGDIRISGRFIDGFVNILAYNYYPTSGDMVIDTGDDYNRNTANNSRILRNLISHELGHGLGFRHVCPVNQTKIMEPLISTAYEGPRHDDIRAVHQYYGDPFEPDNTVSTATSIGALTGTTPTVIGTVPAPSVNFGSLLSIDANGENDHFRFSVAAPVSITVTVTPIGTTYDSSEQACPSDPIECCSGTMFNSLAVANLAIQVIGSNGTTILATAESQPAGAAETIASVALPAAGNYTIRVYETNSPTQPQLYTLSLQSLSTPTCNNCFTIFNDGQAPLQISSVTKPSWATLNPAPPYTVNVGSSLQVGVTACGSCAGSDLTGMLAFNSNDPANPTREVAVTVDCPFVAVAPIIADISDAAIQAPALYTSPTPTLVQGTVPVNWTLQVGPTGMTINATTGVVTWSTSNAGPGPHAVAIAATNAAGFDEEFWSVRVTPVLCIGDANDDRLVSFPDVTEVLRRWGVSYAPATGLGDANKDGVVSFPDVTEILRNWGRSCN